MEVSSFTLNPILPWPVLAALLVAVFATIAVALHRRAAGTVWRALAFSLLFLALLGPTLLEERREEIPSVALVVTDATMSQRLGERKTQTEAAVASLRASLEDFDSIEVRLVTELGGGKGGGTQLFAAVQAALSDVPPDGVAGVVLVTDGQVHDVPETVEKLGFEAPVHALLTGSPDERDRRIVIEGIPGYGIVGESVRVKVRIEDEGFAGETLPLRIAIDGEERETLSLAVGETVEIEFPLERAGLASLSIDVPSEIDELTPDNNRAVIHVNAVRDRLRVMLVSGEPSMGLRHWRDLLHADPAVDLVHFTILRPPSKQDSTPLQELSLIPFPARELFAVNLDRFDLIIFDRYHLRGILPSQYLTNIVEYVVQGGSLLDVAGPTYAGPLSLVNTPLRNILPTLPAGEVIERRFVPVLSETGMRHPVTAELSGPGTGDGSKQWGPWFRMIPALPQSGETLMLGADGWPLLQVGRVGDGRVAQLLSDQSWVWARGVEGGGPRADLLRRVVHWLMKEPDLEENALTATVEGGRIEARYRSIDEEVEELEVISPSGSVRTIPLPSTSASTVSIEAPETGLWRLSAGQLSTTALVGVADQLELADPRASAVPLERLTAITGGSLRWLGLQDTPPSARSITRSERASGGDWIGFRESGRHAVSGAGETPLLPWYLFLVLATAALFLAWHREAR